jgi:hypothetical protein
MNCEKEKTLILTYDPISPENQICSTDLTNISTNCISRKINQKKYFLRDKFYNIKGILLKVENIVLFKNDFQDTVANGIFTLNLPTGIEKYSYTTSFDYFYIKDRSTTDATTTIRLVSISGKKTFNTLEWIVPLPSGNTPLTRTLIFKYIDENE